ncbi:hypothetical protein [Vibrio quintilis]|uniref:N-acetyltransferase domain-containing protein n=1 Tax=Vibrio quintilis TaxID=1117707 RepID=A0A1M7YVS9_9VIBR|nr:hypothetical protein [Vibrio quintilis]SHO56596.1 hypothetical protein VQ7734_02365 [Vibrio quintilis]
MMSKRDFELQLLAPSADKAAQFFTHTAVHSGKYDQLITTIRQLRQQVYQEEGMISQAEEKTSYLQQDMDAWHLIGRKQSSGEVLGCVRMFFFQPTDEFPSAEDMIEFGGVTFPHQELYLSHLHTIQSHLQSLRHRKKPLAYIGGMSVKHAGRKLGGGALLSLGINALSRILHQAEGITFARTDKGGAALFQKIGGYLLKMSPGMFYCQSYHSHVQMIGLRPEILPHKSEDVVTRIEQQLKMKQVLAGQ